MQIYHAVGNLLLRRRGLAGGAVMFSHRFRSGESLGTCSLGDCDHSSGQFKSVPQRRSWGSDEPPDGSAGSAGVGVGSSAGAGVGSAAAASRSWTAILIASVRDTGRGDCGAAEIA